MIRSMQTRNLASVLAAVSIITLLEIANIKICTASYTPYKTLTPSQWTDRFTCNVNEGNHTEDCQRHDPNRQDYCAKEEEVCARTNTDWMWRYVDELEPEFRVLIKEKSIDERLANIIYTTITTRGFDPDYFKIRAGDPTGNEKIEKLLIGSQVNETLCGIQLEQMLRLTEEFTSQLDKQRREPQSNQTELDETFIRLARVLDSFGRYESGFLSGRYQSFGSYEQCINTQLKLDSNTTQLVGMRYCWANLDLVPNLSPELRSRKRRVSERGETILAVGICLPESCHSRSLKKYNQTIQKLFNGQFRFPSGIYRNESLRVGSLSCVVDEKSPIGIPTSGKIVLTVLACWILLVSYATYRNDTNNIKDDTVSEEDGRDDLFTSTWPWSNSWLSCLSLTESWNEFVESKPTHFGGGHVSLDALNPLKFIACLMFTMGHGLVTQTGISSGILRDDKLMESDPLLQLMIVGPMAVESFFVFSGLLITYIALKKDTRPNRTDKKTDLSSIALLRFILKCAKLIVSRFLRIYPLFYLAFAFKKGVFVYLGSGPNWNYGLNQNAPRQCQSHSWLSPFMPGALVYANILDRDCLPQTYTIACDLAFAVVIAPFVYLINKWPRLVISLAMVWTLVSNMAGLAEFATLHKSIVWPVADLRSYNIYQIFATHLGYIYMIPNYRMGSIFFGMIAGFVVYRYEQSREIEHKCCPKWLLTGLTWFASLYLTLICLGSALKNIIRSDASWVMRAIAPHFFITLRLFWALSTAVLCLRLVTDWNHTRNIAWMRAKSWKILAKLNYAILLVHLDLLYLDWHLQTHEVHLSNYNVLKTFTFVYVFSIAVSAVLYVMVENPVNKLIKKALAKL